MTAAVDLGDALEANLSAVCNSVRSPKGGDNQEAGNVCSCQDLSHSSAERRI